MFLLLGTHFFSYLYSNNNKVADSKLKSSNPSKNLFQISAPAPGTVTNQIFSPGGFTRPIQPPRPLKKGYVAPRYIELGYVEFTL